MDNRAQLYEDWDSKTEKAPLLVADASAAPPQGVPPPGYVPGYQGGQSYEMPPPGQSYQMPAPTGTINSMPMPNTPSSPTPTTNALKPRGVGRTPSTGRALSMGYRLCGTPGYQRVHAQRGGRDLLGPDEARLTWSNGRTQEPFGPKFSEIVPPETDREMKAAQATEGFPAVSYRKVNVNALVGDDTESTGEFTQKMVVPIETRSARLEHCNSTVTAWHENTKAKPIAVPDIPVMAGESVLSVLPVTAFTNPSVSMASLAEKRGHVVLTEMPNPANKELSIRRLLFVGLSESAAFKGHEENINGKPFQSSEYPAAAKFKKQKSWEYMSRQVTSHSFAALCIENEVSNVQATTLDAQMVESMKLPEMHIFDFCGRERFPKPPKCVLWTPQNKRIALNVLLTLGWIIAAIVWGQHNNNADNDPNDDDRKDQAKEEGVATVILLLAWLGLLIFRFFAPLNASFIWSVDGEEKTIDRTAAHHSVIQLGTSEDEAAKERQYGIQYRAVSITYRDPLTGLGNQMFAMVSPAVTPTELFKFTSLSAPLNGLFIKTDPARDPFIAGLSTGQLGGAIPPANADLYADFINSVLSDQGPRFEISELGVLISASASIFGRCLKHPIKLVLTPIRKCGRLCFK